MDKEMDKQQMIQISVNPTGAYITYKVPVTRGIRGKTRGRVDELLIVGIPLKNDRFQQWCIRNNIYITNKAVYDARTEEKLLIREGDSLNYIKETT